MQIPRGVPAVLLLAVIATLTGIAFGIVPAWQASRTKPAESLKASERKTGGHTRRRNLEIRCILAPSPACAAMLTVLKFDNGKALSGGESGDGSIPI